MTVTTGPFESVTVTVDVPAGRPTVTVATEDDPRVMPTPRPWALAPFTS